ncbi:MAG: glutamine phosphoribosylpyrophosphate amidotransferase [Bacteroidota bacterium]|jgi:amidophosphoribosyltransferase|nr:glutamine phosphoribosylpyrophosphate amidotransferase [Bacteroidota bacterium]
MSDKIEHECGVALIRLLKPLSFYKEKYGSSRYGLHKMYQLMDKMINRGQDGAGVATIKLDVEAGTPYINRLRSIKPKATQDIFSQINDFFINAKEKNPDAYKDVEWQKKNIPYMGELILGHLRYGTYGGNTIQSCHPFRRQNNWMARNLLVAGNFNLTNVDELLDHLVELGQHPTVKADTVTVMEKIGHFLDKENDRLFKQFKEQGLTNFEISKEIQTNIDVASILIESSKRWDGGYVMAGMMGHGDSFVLRDPNGIRPAYVYKDDEVIVVASERPVIQTVFNVDINLVKELKPGCAAIIKKDGSFSEQQIIEPLEKKACSFERIYFSRGNDADIYRERQLLGRYLVPQVLKAIDYDLENTVFSYIPNTAEVAFGGLVEGIDDYINKVKATEILKLGANVSEPTLSNILARHPRIHKVVLKDAKQRTFITDDESRDNLVNLVYDITYGTVKKDVDTLVVLDDSIVRGTTLKQSILRILDRLHPKKIIIISSAPQIRYPDCYGIDMAILGKFVAFNAAIALIKETGKESILNNLYEKAKAELLKPKEEQVNIVQEVYRTFTNEEISQKIADLVRPKNLKANLQIIYQTIEGLHQSCPDNLGDWYFTGNYPTPGGNKVSNKAFVNYMEGKNERAY